MAPNSVFVDAFMMHLIAIILQIFREKIWFGLATNYEKNCVRKPMLANLETRIFKNLSPMQTFVVPPGENNISNLLTALIIFIRPLLFESWFSRPEMQSSNSRASLDILNLKEDDCR